MLNPWSFVFIILFKGRNFFCFHFGQANIIQPVEQAIFAKGFDIKRNDILLPRVMVCFSKSIVRGADGRLTLFRRRFHLFFGKPNGQDAILKRVVVKNVGSFSNHTPNAHVQNGPWRMLTRRSTTEILARDKNARTRILGLVQHEVRTRGCHRRYSGCR